MVERTGMITGADIDEILPVSKNMILFKGQACLCESAAFALTDAGVTLVGTDALNIEADAESFPAHKQLLGAEVLILEGLDLSLAEPGNYRLIAFPLLMEGAEASPVRAVLIQE